MTGPQITQVAAGPQGPSGPPGVDGLGYNRITQTAVVANGSFTVPAGQAIAAIFIEETANHAITGGLDIGTTDGGADVASAVAVAGHALVSLYGADAALLKRFFSMSADTIIYVDAHTAWNSASVNIQVLLYKLT